MLQDDVVFPHLTVKETLTYAALLRLSSTLTREQKKERAMNVINELGLERCDHKQSWFKMVFSEQAPEIYVSVEEIFICSNCQALSISVRKSDGMNIYLSTQDVTKSDF